jgi:drug/metabolite transporter (DMT)-like permease
MVLFLGASLSSRSGTIEWSIHFLLVLAGLAVPGTAVAFALWFALIRRAPLNALNVFSFLTPVFALGIGAGFYGERLTGFEIAGACVVIAGAWMAARRPKAASASKRPLEEAA